MRVLFENASVFDGTSRYLLEGQFVLTENGFIKEVSDRPFSGSVDARINVDGRTLMPGLIDLHVHIWVAGLDLAEVVNSPTEYLALFAANALGRSLDRGFTTLRDAGGTDFGYVAAIEKGFIAAPRLYHSGRMLTQTGGHTDWRNEMQQALDTCPCCPPMQSRFTTVVDGVDAVRKAARNEFRRGARQLKMICSGGIGSPTGSVDMLQFTDAEICAATEEAARFNSYVFAHCHPDAAIRRCAELGVRCIEHASFISEETARILSEKGTYVVPTLAVIKALNDDGARRGLPIVSQHKLSGMYDAMLRGLEIMHRAGVKMGYGTDLLGPHQDQQCSEFELRADVLPAYDILTSATSTAAEILMAKGELGVIAPGARADIIVVDGDPLRDVRLLAQGGRNLSLIMKDGRFHKNIL